MVLSGIVEPSIDGVGEVDAYLLEKEGLEGY
jgi:hypothetical protein